MGDNAWLCCIQGQELVETICAPSHVCQPGTCLPVHSALVLMQGGALGICPEGLLYMWVHQAPSTSLVTRILLDTVWLGLAA